MLFLGAELALLYSLGGFPPRAWLDLYTLWPHLATLAQNGQTSYIILLWVQAICWLVAWLASILMALLIVSYLAGKLQPAQAEENLALRHYFSQEDTMIMPAIPTLPTISRRYPLHPVSLVEETRSAFWWRSFCGSTVIQEARVSWLLVSLCKPCPTTLASLLFYSSRQPFNFVTLVPVRTSFVAGANCATCGMAVKRVGGNGVACEDCKPCEA